MLRITVQGALREATSCWLLWWPAVASGFGACRSVRLLIPQVNSGLARQMIDKAKEKDLFLTEGLWTRWFPATQKCATASVAAHGDSATWQQCPTLSPAWPVHVG